jgi:hypothetical protein
LCGIRGHARTPRVKRCGDARALGRDVSRKRFALDAYGSQHLNPRSVKPIRRSTQVAAQFSDRFMRQLGLP